jgi:hypothetical protein
MHYTLRQWYASGAFHHASIRAYPISRCALERCLFIMNTSGTRVTSSRYALTNASDMQELPMPLACSWHEFAWPLHAYSTYMSNTCELHSARTYHARICINFMMYENHAWNSSSKHCACIQTSTQKLLSRSAQLSAHTPQLQHVPTMHPHDVTWNYNVLSITSRLYSAGA